jgi:hypothetical protein
VIRKAELQGTIGAALGEGNRDATRFSEFANSSSATGRVYVKFAINDNLSENLIVGGAQLDCTNILKAIAQSNASFGDILIIGTFPMSDAFGNVKETEVVRLGFDAATVQKINWNGFSYKNIYAIADSANVDPQFRP